MTEPSLTAEEAIAAAVRAVDEGVDYGTMGIDAPPEVGRRAMDILAPAVERQPDDLRLRCIYSAAISLAGRLADAREQLGIVLSKDPAYFEAVAELDHPSAWRHVFLSPPWSTRTSRLAPLMRRWVLASGQLRFASLREGPDRVVSVLAAVPADLGVDPGLAAAPVAFDANLLTRSSGAFLAMHVGIGGPEPEKVRVLDGFEFPWPEGTGFRSELLLRFFLQQDRTYLILARSDGTVLLNRPLRFGAEDRERHERFLRRLEAASPRDTDTRLQQATITRYFEEVSPDALRARLAYRLRQGHAPPEPLAEEERLPAAPPPEGQRIQTVPLVVPDVPEEPRHAAAKHPPDPAPHPAAPAPALAPAPPVELPPEPETTPTTPEELAARSALAVAGLWPWVRRERLLGHGVPLLLGLTGIAGALAVSLLGPPSPARLVAGALLGLAAGILVAGLFAARLESSLRGHIEQLIEAADGAVTVESLAEAIRTRGPEVLGGRWGARLRRRLLRLLTPAPSGAR
jgi:hypothetical protein